MRTNILVILFTAILILIMLTFQHAKAQSTYEAIYYNQEPSRHAKAVFDDVTKALGVKSDTIKLYRNDYIPNAAAAVIPGDNDFEKVIIYNPYFMTQLEITTGSKWAAISVMAHELGHHIAHHITPENWDRAMQHPWDKELEADYHSGVALAKLGAKPEELAKAQRQMFTMWGNPSHPDTISRIEQINKGGKAGGGKGDVATDLETVWNDIRKDLNKWWDKRI